MAHKRKPARNKRKTDSFKARYGMTRGEWAEFKRKSTSEEVLVIRNKARKLLK